jgi:hypothetical protein
LGFKSQFFNTEVKIMKVVSYEDLFGSNDIIAYCEDLAIEKDGKKYFSVEVLKTTYFEYLDRWVQEVEFE